MSSATCSSPVTLQRVQRQPQACRIMELGMAELTVVRSCDTLGRLLILERSKRFEHFLKTLIRGNYVLRGL